MKTYTIRIHSATFKDGELGATSASLGGKLGATLKPSKTKISGGLGGSVKGGFSIRGGLGGSANPLTYTIYGTATPNTTVGSTENVASSLTATFQESGWDLTRPIELSYNGAIYNIRIVARVEPQHSLSEIEQSAMETIAADTIFGLYPTLKNVNLSVSKGSVTTPRAVSGGIDASPKKTGNLNFQMPDLTKFQVPDLTGGNFLGNVGTGLGLSSPFAMLAAAVLIVLVLKR